MIRRLYDWILGLAENPNALWIMAAVSFVESSVFPITPLVMVIPMVLARPERAWLIAGVCTIASVLGGIGGWLIGWGLFEEVGRPVLEFYGMDEKFAEISQRFNEFGTEAVLFAAVSPFPYKVVTIFSGTTGLPLWQLIIASIIGRGIQFFLVAGMLWKFGEPVREFVEKRLAFFATLFVVLIIGGFVAIKYVI
ncbi:DedA family protein [Rhodobacteraceae bacterium NNCM2]|nr:DedA family protein [Coraliihabitans acroporae]